MARCGLKYKTKKNPVGPPCLFLHPIGKEAAQVHSTDGTMGHLTLRSEEGWQQEGAGRLRVPGAPRRQNLSRNFPGLVPAAVSVFSLSQMAVPGFRGICCLLITEETSRKQQKVLR